MDPLAIAEDIKEKIIWLDLEPGSTLNLAELARSYGVSRNPVNIALARLDMEELVVRNGSHYVVSPLTVERIRDITEIRSVMEVQAATWAMHRFSEKGLKKLREHHEAIKSLPDQAKNKTIVRLDLAFHQIIYRETKNQSLERMLTRMLTHYLRFWLSSPNRIVKDSFFKEHLEIIQAITEKDETRLRAACSGHIRASLDEIMGI